MPNLQRIDEVVAALLRREEAMQPLAESFEQRDEAVYVSARELGEFLGYKDPKNFMSCVHRAQSVAVTSGVPIQSNFLSPELFDREQEDLWLSPWAAFASIMEADVTKKKVAIAKSFFASLVDEQLQADEARLKERQLFKRNHKELHGAAEKAGVKSGIDHAKFDDAGYRGMYNMGIRDVERRKGLTKGQRLIDHAGPTELAANNLRMAMTKDDLDAGKATNKQQANRLHAQKGKVVRDAVVKGVGMTPESLPVESRTLDAVSREIKKSLKDSKAL